MENFSLPLLLLFSVYSGGGDLLGRARFSLQERAVWWWWWHTLGTKTAQCSASAAQAGFRFKSSRRGRRVAESAGGSGVGA